MIGLLKTVSREDLEQIHENSIKLLEEKGCKFSDETALDIFKKHGLKVDGDVVFFTREIIEKSLEQCPSKFKLTAIDDSKSCIVGEGILTQPPGGEVFINHLEGERTEATIQDYANFQKLYEVLNNIDMAGFQPVSVKGIDQRVVGHYCTLETMKNSTKPWLSPMNFQTCEEIQEHFDMYEIAMGKKGYLEDHYMTWYCICPNSPLIYSKFACNGIIEYAKRNQPVLIVSAPLAGITAPLSIYGTALLENAEILAGLTLAQLVRPGVPVVPSASLVYGNMQRASWECACPETALAVNVMTQMFREVYKLPARAIIGVTSSKDIDSQSGYETMQSFLLASLSGLQLAVQNVGTLDNLMASSLEKTVIDDEIVGRTKRILEGVSTSVKDLSYDTILQTDFGGDFMKHKTTIKNCRKSFRPTVANWDSYEGWVKDGSEDIKLVANKKVTEILNNAPESLLDKEVEKDLVKFIKKIEENKACMGVF